MADITPPISVPPGFDTLGDPTEATFALLVPKINHLVRVALLLYGSQDDLGPAPHLQWPPTLNSPLLDQAKQLDATIQSSESVGATTQPISLKLKKAVENLLAAADEFISRKDIHAATLEMEKKWILDQVKLIGAVDSVSDDLKSYHATLSTTGAGSGIGLSPAQDERAKAAFKSMQNAVNLAGDDIKAWAAKDSPENKLAQQILDRAALLTERARQGGTH